jgi:hypothetical protein
MQHKCIHESLKKEFKCKHCEIWPWKVPKWPWFLAEVAVKPFWNLAILIFFRPLVGCDRSGASESGSLSFVRIVPISN